MQKFEQDENLQAEACRAIMNVSCGNPTFRKDMLEEGGLDAVTAAMINFPRSSFLQQCALGAIANLAYRHRGNIELNSDHELDVIATIVSAMKRFPTNAQIQMFACDCLYNIANGGGRNKEEHLKRVIVQKDGLSVLGNAAKYGNRADNKYVQRKAGRALKLISGSILV